MSVTYVSGNDLWSWPGIAERGIVLLPGESTQHQPDHADPDLCLARIGPPLMVLAVDAAAAQPSEDPLHHPAPSKVAAPLGATDHLLEPDLAPLGGDQPGEA